MTWEGTRAGSPPARGMPRRAEGTGPLSLREEKLPSLGSHALGFSRGDWAPEGRPGALRVT